MPDHNNPYDDPNWLSGEEFQLANKAVDSTPEELEKFKNDLNVAFEQLNNHLMKETMNQSFNGITKTEAKAELWDRMTNYRKSVIELWNKKLNSQQTLNAAAMGLSGESGEVVDLLKKHIFHEHPLDKDKLVKEIGDCLYYAEILMNEIGVTRSEVEMKNLEKLYNRYPQGFSPEASKNRKD